MNPYYPSPTYYPNPTFTALPLPTWSPYPVPILPTLTPSAPTWVHLSTFEAFAVDPHGLMLWVSLAVIVIAILTMFELRGKNNGR